jgi:rod shape-determining protein MreB
MLGVDLGTTHIRIHLRGQGVVLREPAVVAVAEGTREVKAMGEEAYQMLGRTPAGIVAVKPLVNGVIADYSLTGKLLQTLIRKVMRGSSRFIRPGVMVCVPSGATEVEKRAVLQAVGEVGARRVSLIEEPVAGAIGAGINASEPRGVMVIDVGGGTTDIAVISLGGIVVAESLRVAGNTFDEDIIRFVRHRDNLLIGERSAETIKREVGAAFASGGGSESLEVRGRDLIGGAPKAVTITTEDVVEALGGSLQKVAEGVKRVLEQAPPELISDIVERGIVMTGGGSLLRNFDVYLRRLTDIPVAVADNPSDCVVLGAGKALETPSHSSALAPTYTRRY